MRELDFGDHGFGISALPTLRHIAQIFVQLLVEIKQVKNFLDQSLRAHLESKGALCSNCEQPNDLCRCIKRADMVRAHFEPLALRSK